jgi:hypothetical protein
MLVFLPILFLAALILATLCGYQVSQRIYRLAGRPKHIPGQALRVLIFVLVFLFISSLFAEYVLSLFFRDIFRL